MENCLLADEDGIKCAVCDLNYYHSNGKCWRSNLYKTTYDGRNPFEIGFDKVGDFTVNTSKKGWNEVSDFFGDLGSKIKGIFS